jgi:hypothetical protein
VDTSQELPGRKSSSSGLENREHGCKVPSRWSRDALYPQKLALTSRTSGGRSIGIVRSRTKATELLLFIAVVLRNDVQILILDQWGGHLVFAYPVLVSGNSTLYSCIVSSKGCKNKSAVLMCRRFKRRGGGGRLRNAPKILKYWMEETTCTARCVLEDNIKLELRGTRWVRCGLDHLAPMSVTNTCESGNGMLCFLNGKLLLGWLCGGAQHETGTVFLHVTTVL